MVLAGEVTEADPAEPSMAVARAVRGGAVRGAVPVSGALGLACTAVTPNGCPPNATTPTPHDAPILMSERANAAWPDMVFDGASDGGGLRNDRMKVVARVCQQERVPVVWNTYACTNLCFGGGGV